MNRLKLDRKELLKRLAAAESRRRSKGAGATSRSPCRPTRTSRTFPRTRAATAPCRTRARPWSASSSGRSRRTACSTCARRRAARRTHLAELMGDQGEIVAVEKMAPRARSMRAADRCASGSAPFTSRPPTARPRTWPAFGKGGPYDRALVDAPCSSLGVLARRADARWRKEAAGFAELAELQGRLAARRRCASSARAACWCTVCARSSRRRRTRSSQSFLAGNAEWSIDDAAQYVPGDLVEAGGAMRILPHRHGTDGAFAVRLVRKAD